MLPSGPVLTGTLAAGMPPGPSRAPGRPGGPGRIWSGDPAHRGVHGVPAPCPGSTALRQRHSGQQRQAAYVSTAVQTEQPPRLDGHLPTRSPGPAHLLGSVLRMVLGRGPLRLGLQEAAEGWGQGSGGMSQGEPGNRGLWKVHGCWPGWAVGGRAYACPVAVPCVRGSGGSDRLPGLVPA